MALIATYLIVEIIPIWIVSDGNFVDIFLKTEYLMEQKDLVRPLLDESNPSNHSHNFDPESPIF